MSLNVPDLPHTQLELNLIFRFPTFFHSNNILLYILALGFSLAPAQITN